MGYDNIENKLVDCIAEILADARRGGEVWGEPLSQDYHLAEAILDEVEAYIDDMCLDVDFNLY